MISIYLLPDFLQSCSFLLNSQYMVVEYSGSLNVIFLPQFGIKKLYPELR